jgi:hypothetical protein
VSAPPAARARRSPRRRGGGTGGNDAHLRGSTLYGLVGVHQLEKLLDRLLAGPRIPSEGRLQSERRDKGYKRDSDGLVSNRCGRGSWLAELRAAVRPDARGHDAHDERSR